MPLMSLLLTPTSRTRKIKRIFNGIKTCTKDVSTKANRAKAAVAKVLAEVTAKVWTAAMAVVKKIKQAEKEKPAKARRILVLVVVDQDQKTQLRRRRLTLQNPK